MLAIINNGLSQVRTINTTVTEIDKNSSKKGGNFGFRDALSLFGMTGSLNAEINKNKDVTNQSNNSTEKAHTPSSLFSNLRRVLKDKGYIHTIKIQSDIRDLKCGKFVEFRSRNLNINPFIDYFSRINETSKLASVFTQESDQITLDELLNDFKKLNTTEIIGKVLDDNQVNAVLSCKSDCFINNDKDTLTNGEFCVFGKVTNILVSKRDKIDLLQKTSFRSLDENFIKTITNAFDENGASGIDMPKVTTKIEAPAIQVLPIAIFI